MFSNVQYIEYNEIFLSLHLFSIDICPFNELLEKILTIYLNDKKRLKIFLKIHIFGKTEKIEEKKTGK